MKTQNTGYISFYHSNHAHPLTNDPHFCQRLQDVLLDYREKRENGNNADLPSIPFPSGSFETLKIADATAQDWDKKWPDEKGRYWYQITLKDNTVINHFYWMEDRIRGYPDPDNENRYWFTLHHSQSEITIMGLFQEYDQQKSLSNKYGHHWYSIQFMDRYSSPIFAWMEEKDHRYLTRVFLENLATKNYEEIYILLNDVYEKNHTAFSGCFLGMMHEYGLGREESTETAARHYQAGAAIGYPLAQVLLAANFIAKIQNDDHIQKAETLFTQALTPLGPYQQGYYYDLYAAVLPFFLKIATKDSKNNANLVLAAIYERGLLGIKRSENHIIYYRNAAFAGNIWAQINLARRGIEIPRALLYSSDQPLTHWENVLRLITATLDGNFGILVVQNYPAEFSDIDRLSELMSLIISRDTSTLIILDFSYNKLQDEMQNAIVKLVMNLPYLQNLILNFNLITKSGLKELLFRLREHKNLKELQLRNNRIDEQNKEIFYSDFIEPILFEKDYGTNAGIRIDLSLNLMTPALNDKMLSQTYKKLVSALCSVLITLNRPIEKIREIELKTIRVNNIGKTLLGFTRKNKNGEDIFEEKPIKEQHLESLISFQKSISSEIGNRALEINEISDILLGHYFSQILERDPSLAPINLKEEPTIKHKEITKRLLQSHPETPLKYLLTYHPLFSDLMHPKAQDDSEWPCLLVPDFHINQDRWVVYLMIKSNPSHAFLAWEGLYRHGQRCFERVHLTAEIDDTNSLNIIKDEAQWIMRRSGRPAIVTSCPPAFREGGLSKKPNWFEYARGTYHIVAVYATRQQVKNMAKAVKDEIISKEPPYKHRIVVTQSPSKLPEDLAIKNCITWAEDKINFFLELPLAHQITGTGITNGNLYAPRTQEEALQQFHQRNDASNASAPLTSGAADSIMPSPQTTIIAATGMSVGVGMSALIRNYSLNRMNAALISYAEQVDRQLLNPGPIINAAIHDGFHSQLYWPSFFRTYATPLTIGTLGAVGAVGAFRLVSWCRSSYTNSEAAHSNRQNESSASSELQKTTKPN